MKRRGWGNTYCQRNMDPKREVQVNLVLGHRVQLREKEASEDSTHNLTVFVRGSQTVNMKHFVEKVVFHLPKSYPEPKRVCREPPYEVVVMGSAGFLMHIELFFQNKEQPKKVCFKYNLILEPEGDHLRSETLTFSNPAKDFRRKLTKAGGVIVVPQETEAASRSSPDSSIPPRKKIKTSHVTEEPSKDGSDGSIQADTGAL